MSLTSSYLGDQEDLVLQGTQVLGSPLPHSVQGGLQSVREGDKLTFPIKSLPPKIVLASFCIFWKFHKIYIPLLQSAWNSNIIKEYNWNLKFSNLRFPVFLGICVHLREPLKTPSFENTATYFRTFSAANYVKRQVFRYSLKQKYRKSRVKKYDFFESAL